MSNPVMDEGVFRNRFRKLDRETLKRAVAIWRFFGPEWSGEVMQVLTHVMGMGTDKVNQALDYLYQYYEEEGVISALDEEEAGQCLEFNQRPPNIGRRKYERLRRMFNCFRVLWGLPEISMNGFIGRM